MSHKYLRQKPDAGKNVSNKLIFIFTGTLPCLQLQVRIIGFTEISVKTYSTMNELYIFCIVAIICTLNVDLTLGQSKYHNFFLHF